MKTLGVFIDLFSGKTEAVKNACKLYSLGDCKKNGRKEGRKERREGGSKDRRKEKRREGREKRISITI